MYTTRLTHNAELIAMNVAIGAIDRASRNDFLRSVLRQAYCITRNEKLMAWLSTLLVSSIAGYLLGYLAYFLLPR